MMTLALLGFGWDASSSHARGAAAAPWIIRAQLFSPASSPYSLDGLDVAKAIAREALIDLGEDGAAARARIEAEVDQALGAGLKPLSLGGDHSVTFPILKAVASAFGPVDVLHVDAHPDTYEAFEGDPYSHASPFARALEAGCIRNLVQVGLRSVTPETRAQAERYGVVSLGAGETDRVPWERFAGPIYVSIDLDGLDPAFAPGVSHPEPGGLSVREVLDLIATLRRVGGRPIVGADVVEYNPERDQGLATARVAARLVKELAALLSA